MIIIISDKEQRMNPKLHSTLDVGGEQITGFLFCLLTYSHDQTRGQSLSADKLRPTETGVL